MAWEGSWRGRAEGGGIASHRPIFSECSGMCGDIRSPASGGDAPGGGMTPQEAVKAIR